MTALGDFLGGLPPEPDHRPFPRIAVSAETWRLASEALAEGALSLAGLWGDTAMVHMAVADPGCAEYAVLSLPCAGGTFPSVARLHPPALRLERTIADLFGHAAEGATDGRPWLDHGRWPARPPLAVRPRAAPVEPYAFLPAEGESLHQIPVGPVHAGIIEPGHFRFTANGEAVVRLEQRLGYVHKGIDALMKGAAIDKAARIAGRVSGDATVAYAIAFARAVEAAAGVAAPPRAVWLRALMAELERIANHFGDIGAVCNDAAFSLMHAHTGALRERTLRAAAAAFGHRLMMDKVVPGGVAADLGHDGDTAVRALVAEVRARFPELVALYDGTASLQDRTVGTGFTSPALVRQYAAGGHVGRASGRGIDSRKNPGYPPYDQLAFEVPVLADGDVNARVWVRIREVEASLGLIDQLLAGLPGGALAVAVPPLRAGEGMALAESFRGDVLAWVRLAGDGTVARGHLRDPSWFQWPLLEAAIEGNIVADFPLCNKSFNCSYSGHDL